PLVEFEETLLSGAGTATASDTFRLMDPISHRMVGVRADMTPQIARIAASRMSHMPRPLRLSYAGQVLRVKGSEMRPERQIGQAGAELIGAEGPAADVEAVAVAAEALQAVGVPHLSVDLTLPTLVPAIVEAYGLAGPREAALRAALDHKDAAAVGSFAGGAAPASRAGAAWRRPRACPGSARGGLGHNRGACARQGLAGRGAPPRLRLCHRGPRAKAARARGKALGEGNSDGQCRSGRRP